MRHNNLVISPAKTGTVLGVISVYLASQSLFNEYIESFLNTTTHNTAILLLDLFSVNVEESIPTWYSVLLLFGAALLLGVIAKAKWELKDKFSYYWASLALVFVYLSIDEGAAIHEILSEPLQAIFHLTGYLAFAWQVVAVPLVILLVVLFIPFLWHLPARWRYLFVLSGAVYVTGALGIEAISANRWYTDSSITLPYLALGTAEELFEMLGIVLFIYTLTSYIAAQQATLALVFSSQENTVAPLEAAPEPVNTKVRAQKWRWVVIPLVSLILLINGGVYFWATQAQPNAPTTAKTTPFYQMVAEKYAGQGIVVLKINEPLVVGSPTTQQFATALLVLFNDVVVVSPPQANFSIAFASAALPFSKDDLAVLLSAEGYEAFTILDTQELKALTPEAP